MRDIDVVDLDATYPRLVRVGARLHEGMGISHNPWLLNNISQAWKRSCIDSSKIIDKWPRYRNLSRGMCCQCCHANSVIGDVVM